MKALGAVINKNIKTVKRYVNKKNVNEKHGLTGDTLLHFSNDFEISKFLIGVGADPNIKNEAGETPFFEPAFQNNYKIIELLIYAGVDPFIKNKDNETALDIATEDTKNFILNTIAKNNLLVLVKGQHLNSNLYREIHKFL